MDYVKISDEWDVLPSQVKAFEKFLTGHGYDLDSAFNEVNFADAYAGEADDDTDHALYRWYLEEFLEDYHGADFVRFMTMARDMGLRVSVSETDVDVQFYNVDGYVFYTNF